MGRASSQRSADTRRLHRNPRRSRRRRCPSQQATPSSSGRIAMRVPAFRDSLFGRGARDRPALKAAGRPGAGLDHDGEIERRQDQGEAHGVVPRQTFLQHQPRNTMNTPA